MNSIVEIEENVITIQDYEKSVSFCELIRSDPQDLMNIKPITEWYDQIVKAIAEMQKRFRICSICNQNCEFNAELDEQIRTAHDMSPVKASKPGKDTLKAVLCRGCGRCICTKCMDMHADALKSAVDKTLYCVPCQIWNKRELASTEVYKAMSSDRVGAWVRAVGDIPSNKFYYNPTTKEVCWDVPAEGIEEYQKSSYLLMQSKFEPSKKNGMLLSYVTPDGKLYHYNTATDQVQWRTTVDTMGGVGATYCCMNCGHESSTWYAVCNDCKKRLSL